MGSPDVYSRRGAMYIHFFSFFFFFILRRVPKYATRRPDISRVLNLARIRQPTATTAITQGNFEIVSPLFPFNLRRPTRSYWNFHNLLWYKGFQGRFLFFPFPFCFCSFSFLFFLFFCLLHAKTENVRNFRTFFRKHRSEQEDKTTANGRRITSKGKIE